MRTTATARRYARATFEVAQQSGDPVVWQAQLETMADALSDPAILPSLQNPAVPIEEKVRALKAGFEGMPPELANLGRILLERNRIGMMPVIAAAFAENVDEMLGRTEADVVSARELTAEQLQSIGQHLNQRTGLTVRLRTAVDPSLLGGVILRIGDEVIDGSVSTRLERLRQKLA